MSVLPDVTLWFHVYFCPEHEYYFSCFRNICTDYAIDLLSVLSSYSGVEYIYGAHCLFNTDVIAIPVYRNSMKLSCFEFGLCICSGKNEKHSFDSLKMWGFFFSTLKFVLSFSICNFNVQLRCNRGFLLF